MVMAFSFALPKAGSNMLARIEMMVMTTSSSIRVKPCRFDFTIFTGSPSSQYSRGRVKEPMKKPTILRRRPSFGPGLHLLDGVLQGEALLRAHLGLKSHLLQVL